MRRESLMSADRTTMESLAVKLEAFGEGLTEPEQILLSDLLGMTSGADADVEGFALASSDAGAASPSFAFLDVFAEVAVRREAALRANGKRGWYYPTRQRAAGSA